MLGSSFKYRPPAKLLSFSETGQTDLYHIMTLSSRFGGLCTALEKLLRSVLLLVIVASMAALIVAVFICIAYLYIFFFSMMLFIIMIHLSFYNTSFA